MYLSLYISHSGRIGRNMGKCDNSTNLQRKMPNMRASNLSVAIKCPRCKGTGYEPNAPFDEVHLSNSVCGECGGRGEYYQVKGFQ